MVLRIVTGLLQKLSSTIRSHSRQEEPTGLCIRSKFEVVPPLLGVQSAVVWAARIQNTVLGTVGSESTGLAPGRSWKSN